ncbi:MAG: extracellular solute-binding protein [Lachnospiraceae bacterium]|nr:extracellular solute-binding protein [Lachnospiraceae bacterium]
MKRKKWICLLLSVILLLAGCGDRKNGSDNTGGSENSAQGGDASAAPVTGGIEADGFYDIELTEETIAPPLQEGEIFLGAQYFNGERIWFIGNNSGQIFCYYEEQNERELLLENVSAGYQVGYTWYRDEEYFYVYSNNVLAVLRSDGEEAYTLRPEGRIIDICMSREGDIVLVEDSGMMGDVLKILNKESGTLSGKYTLSDCYGIAEGAARGVMIIDLSGVYDWDMESGEKTWYVKWNGTSYRPGMAGGMIYAFKMTEEGILEQFVRDGENFYVKGLKKVSLEEMGKTPLVFKVLYANEGLKLLVAKFNKENQEYHVFLQDRGEEYGWDFAERNDLEIATGKGPDLIAEDAVSDIYALAAKGALENLEPYFAQEEMSRDAYTPAAFQSLGREDGIYGMGYEMQVITHYIREELAGNNIETLLNNMENYDGQAIYNSLYNYTPNKLLDYFFQMSNDFYGMVDWEGKTCDFSGELWEKILRVVKKYGVTDRNQQWDEIARPVFGGQILSFAKADAEAMQEGMILAGYPTEEGMKHRLCVYGVSINAASEHKDGAWQFIKFLLEEENQRLVEKDFRLPVHEKVLQEYVDAQAEQFYYNTSIWSEGMAVQEEQLARFWECLNDAETAPYRTEHILEIIEEEAELYFTEDKSIEEISGIIENRVRLYLAELE